MRPGSRREPSACPTCRSFFNCLWMVLLSTGLECPCKASALPQLLRRPPSTLPVGDVGPDATVPCVPPFALHRHIPYTAAPEALTEHLLRQHRRDERATDLLSMLRPACSLCPLPPPPPSRAPCRLCVWGTMAGSMQRVTSCLVHVGATALMGPA